MWQTGTVLGDRKGASSKIPVFMVIKLRIGNKHVSK